jgi:hypothetical protein
MWLGSCALFKKAPEHASAHAPLPEVLADVRIARDRPPFVLVAREGDPALVVAVAVTTSGASADQGRNEEPEISVAIAAMLESRLEAERLNAQVRPSYDGFLASFVAVSEAEAKRATKVLRDALLAPVTARDVEAAEKKLNALSRRPLEHEALRHWARCTGDLRGLAERRSKDTTVRFDRRLLERWKSTVVGTLRVSFAVTGPKVTDEAIASIVLEGAPWSEGTSLRSLRAEHELSATVVETIADRRAQPSVFVTLDVGASRAAVESAPSLGDPRGALALKLRELPLPFSIREVIGTSHPTGGCLGIAIALDASSPPSSSALTTEEVGTHAAEAIALVRSEALAAASRPRGAADGRAVAGQTGDAREAAERAAWWNLADRVVPSEPETIATMTVPARRSSEAMSIERLSRTLTSALSRATRSWETTMIEARSRLEPGQAEAWVLVGSPCGADDESSLDTGVSALAIRAMAQRGQEDTAVVGGATLEPWVSSDGVGIVAHGLPLPGESAVLHAERLANAAARTFLAEPLSSSTLARARTELLRQASVRSSPSLEMLASVLAPRQPSVLAPFGLSDALANTPDGAVLIRAQALRKGLVRIAMLANHSTPQAMAATKAADRWLSRTANLSRSCSAFSARTMPTPGTYAATLRAGSLPEAYLAYPLPSVEERDRQAAAFLATAITSTLAMGKTEEGYSLSARVLGWPKAPALVVHVSAPQAGLDEAVMSVRGLITQWQKDGFAVPDFERLREKHERDLLVASLEPRTRLLATWRSEPIGRSPPVTRDAVRGLLTRHVSESSLVIVTARPPRVQASP